MSDRGAGVKWRFLIVEDEPSISALLEEIVPACVDAPDEAEAVVCKNFKEAIGMLRVNRFDLLILDLKDDSGKWFGGQTDETPGLTIFEELKKTRFIPVVFYTAFDHKILEEQTSFVRVVKKPEPVTRVRDEIRRVLATKLPSLNRHIEELQRSYMWDFVKLHWKEFTAPQDQADIAYLLARRLALSLQDEAIKLAGTVAGKEFAVPASADIHPMQMYVRPPIGEKRLAGDIVRGLVGGETGVWLVLTPSCDFEQLGRLNHVLLAHCLPIADQPEFQNWKKDPSKGATDTLRALIQDNRAKAQSERFKFLPGTFFLEDSIVDFQVLKTVTPEDLGKLEVVASLDSPFAEAVLARFARYFGRIGTPDISKDIVLRRLGLPSSPGEAATPNQASEPGRSAATKLPSAS